MIEQIYDYLIIGVGRAGGSAAEGIRAKDDDGSILMIGNEEFTSYDRPDLSKKLWFGKKTIADIFAFSPDFFTDNSIDLLLNTEVVSLDPKIKIVKDSRGNMWGYKKLLLATGGIPRKLDIPGGDLPGIFYYRYLDDYKALREQVGENKTAVVIGGGFIGSEMAAAMCMNGTQVTMVYPQDRLVPNVFPVELGDFIGEMFKDKGISILKNDTPVSIEKVENRFLTKTRNGKTLESDILLVGIGIIPSTALAEMAKLKVGNGIVVNENLQTSDRDIYAAGDNAFFPYTALDKATRVEHWDNARQQGLHAGWNMTGVGYEYDYMPYFWSDLFDFGYEAVGEVDARNQIFTDWEIENQKGVIYYHRDWKIRGIMTCNIYGKMDDARTMIRSGKEMLPEDLKGAIK